MKQRNTSRKSYLTGEGWIPHRQEMLTSPSWRKRPKALIKLLDRMEIEHLRHGGKENGHFIVTYDQFVEFGVTRKVIKPMLRLGAALGLLQVIQDENWMGDVRQPNRYRLTYLPAKGQKAPSDEWSFLEADQVTAILAAYKAQPATAADDEERDAA